MRSTVRNVAIAVLAIALIALFLRNADLPSVWQEIRRAELGLLAAAIASVFLNMVLRSIRWQYLLEPIGATSFGNAFRTTMIGFAATFVLPARAGELLRPYLLARREGFSATAAFATIVLERVLDLLTVVLLLAVFMMFFDSGPPARAGAVYTRSPRGRARRRSHGYRPARGHVRAGRPSRRCQPGGAQAGAGVTNARRPRHRAAGRTFCAGVGRRTGSDAPRGVVGLVTAALALDSFGIWTTSRAFHIDLPFAGSFLIIALLVVGVSVPTPGGVGGFHEAYRLGATAFYGVPNDRAVGAAIVLHAISFVPVTIVGLLYFVNEGFTLKSMSSLASTAAVEDKIG